MTAFWVCYPTAWIIGPSGVGWTQQATQTTAFYNHKKRKPEGGCFRLSLPLFHD
ncbi:hypothetical protein [Halobacillus aidingensis]|uniref:hypothetical protein n=1 Tax=Halobacillus aidingensis TaxID=240303 RepID=UPI003CC54F4D